MSVSSMDESAGGGRALEAQGLVCARGTGVTGVDPQKIEVRKYGHTVPLAEGTCFNCGRPVRFNLAAGIAAHVDDGQPNDCRDPWPAANIEAAEIDGAALEVADVAASINEASGGTDGNRGASPVADEMSFEELLASPHLQFDLDSELLPHLIAFGPPKPRRPWLFENATSTTVVVQPIHPDVDMAEADRLWAEIENGPPMPAGWCTWHQMVDCAGDAPECREAIDRRAGGAA